jgi:hypothetical protein
MYALYLKEKQIFAYILCLINTSEMYITVSAYNLSTWETEAEKINWRPALGIVSSS